jgi:hypothetical protein
MPKSNTAWLQLLAVAGIVAVAGAWALLAVVFPGL